MENDEDKIIITDEKKPDRLVERIKNSLLAATSIFIVSVVSRYFFEISEDYSLALLMSIGLPTIFTVLVWLIVGEKVDIDKKYGFIIPTVALFAIYLIYTLPKGFYLMLIPIFFLAYLTAIITGIICLYFNKIIKDNLTYRIANRINFRIRIIVSIFTASMAGICLTLFWYYLEVL